MDSGNALHWHGHWRLGRVCCCWMSPSARWTLAFEPIRRQWLRRLHDEVSVTTIFVTRSEEAFESPIASSMNRGRIEQEGTPAEVFEHPANPFVMDFSAR